MNCAESRCTGDVRETMKSIWPAIRSAGGVCLRLTWATPALVVLLAAVPALAESQRQEFTRSFQ